MDSPTERLFLAAARGCVADATLALESGANVNFCFSDVFSPLSVALLNGNHHVAAWLLKHGASLQKIRGIPNFSPYVDGYSMYAQSLSSKLTAVEAVYVSSAVKSSASEEEGHGWESVEVFGRCLDGSFRAQWLPFSDFIKLGHAEEELQNYVFRQSAEKNIATWPAFSEVQLSANGGDPFRLYQSCLGHDTCRVLCRMIDREGVEHPFVSQKIVSGTMQAIEHTLGSEFKGDFWGGLSSLLNRSGLSDLRNFVVWAHGHASEIIKSTAVLHCFRLFKRTNEEEADWMSNGRGPFQHRPHFDGLFTRVSFFVYLNDDFEGGENVMLSLASEHRKFVVSPRAGCGVGFRSDAQLHAAFPVRRGSRYALVLFFRDPFDPVSLQSPQRRRRVSAPLGSKVTSFFP